MSIGRGVQTSILSQVESLGSDLVLIYPGATTYGGVKSAAGSAATLTLEDAEAISEQVPNVTSVVPSSSASLQLVFGEENTRAQITGITPEYQEAYNLETTAGAFITEYDYQSGAKVAIIGPEVKDTLFNDTDPIGQQLRMGNNIVRVIGVLESKGVSMVGSTDDAVLIPLTTLQQTIAQSRTATGEHVVSTIALTVSDGAQASSVVDETASLLRSRHQIAPGDEDDFTINSMEELISTISEMTGTMTLFLGAIAGISLMVGGIGVMNIMLVSVVERTREIGIRKALGAKEGDISRQFLTESAFLSFGGGIIGIAVGVGISKIISTLGIMGDFPPVVSADIVLLALSVAVGIGLFFGFYPARRAARLNPIDALRYG
jgi:putative ABC transport system permease protein